MARNISRDHPRVPPPFEGLQVNFCKNVNCSHFGHPASTEAQPRGPGAAKRPNDGYILGSKDGFRTRLICKTCGQYSMLKSNQGVHEEYSRISSYLDTPTVIRGCKDPSCPNHTIDISSGTKHYHRFSITEIGSQRFRCKVCRKTFSISKRPAARQKTTHKNKAIFKLLVNRVPFKRICEILDISPPTLYRKIDYLHAQSLAFLASREKQFETMGYRRLYICSDRQEFMINWTNTKDKRNVILKAIASVEAKSGYVFGMTSNFDPDASACEVEEQTYENGDDLKSMPFRRHARLWLDSDHTRMARDREHNVEKIAEGALKYDVAARYIEALARDEIEATDDPELHTMLPLTGMQVHEEYTLYGHFQFLKRLLANVGKIRFFLDQDSGMRAACFAAFRSDILAGDCDAFYVRINKDLNLHQKQNLVKAVNRELEDAMSAHPGHSETEIRFMRIIQEMGRLETIGRWEDRWLTYPFPDMSEPEKAICLLTPDRGYSERRMATLYLKASLHAVDSYFNQIRTRLSPLQRGGRSQSANGSTWYGYQPYKPEMVQKLLDILRVFHNFSLKSKEDKKTPAMRLGLAKGPVDLDRIIYFSREEA